MGAVAADVQLRSHLHARVFRRAVRRVVRTARLRTADDRRACGASLVSDAGRPVSQQELPAAAELPGQLELRGQPGRTVLHRAHAEADGAEPRAGRRTRYAESDGRVSDGVAMGRD